MKKTFMGRIFVVCCLIMALFTFAGCTKGEVKDAKSETKTVTVQDFRGKDVTVNYPAKKIVCLLNSGLNDLYMLGAKDSVIGIDKWTYDTPSVAEKMGKIDPRVASKDLPAVDGNIEKIVELQPDVVIVWAESEDIKALEEKGVKVIGVQVNSFADVDKKLDILAKITGTEKRAEEIKNYEKKQMDVLKSKIDSIKEKQTAVFVWGPTTLDIAGQKSTGNSILEHAGLTNKAVEIDKEHFIVSIEDLVEWNPDDIVLWNSADLSEESFVSDPRMSSINAVKNKAILELPDPFYCDLWTVKYIHSIYLTSQKFYPELFKNIDAEAEQKAMTKFLYGIEL